MKPKTNGKQFLKKWAVITAIILALFYITRWQLWGAIILANLTAVDVIIADGYVISGPFIIIGLIYYFASKQWKKIKLARKRAPLEDDELDEAFKLVAEANEELLYDIFLKERLGVTKEVAFSAQQRENLQRILEHNNKVRTSDREYVLHPLLIKRIRKIINSESMDDGRKEPTLTGISPLNPEDQRSSQ